MDHKACVVYRHRGGTTEITVSDPTRANREAITLTFAIPLGRALEARGLIQVKKEAGGTTVTLDLSQIRPDERGRTFKIKLAD